MPALLFPFCCPFLTTDFSALSFYTILNLFYAPTGFGPLRSFDHSFIYLLFLLGLWVLGLALRVKWKRELTVYLGYGFAIHFAIFRRIGFCLFCLLFRPFTLRQRIYFYCNEVMQIYAKRNIIYGHLSIQISIYLIFSQTLSTILLLLRWLFLLCPISLEEG